MRSSWKSALAALALAGVAAAQTDFVFTVNQAQSNFTWSGTSTLGNIVGNPSNAFQATGTTTMHVFAAGVDPIATSDFSNGGDLGTSVALHGKINNPLPFLPPLATIDITNLHMSMGAPVFAVAPNGAFTAALTMTALSGTMVVTPLAGTATTTDLTGLGSTPQNQTGTLLPSGNNLALVMPVNTSFPFSDPASGASGTVTLLGTLRANWTCPTAQTYCTAKTNSNGCVPALGLAGAASYSSGLPFVISATNELNQQNGLLYYGFTQTALPFQGGFKCVGNPTVRSAIQNAGGSPVGVDCSGAFAFDFNQLISVHTDPALVPGADVCAQVWSRDPASPSTTNLANAAKFTIAP